MARLAYSAIGEAEVEPTNWSPMEMYELGLKYCLGQGVDHDLIEAHKWFNLAALRGNRDAREYRSELSEEMTKSEIFTAQRLAREWLQLH